MYTISPESGSISADALPSTKETSATTEGVPEVPSVVTTFLDAAEVVPTTAFAALDSNASTEINNDPRLWQASSVMRYNLLHSQIVNIQVPCNSEIEAGDIVRLEIESISDKKEENPYDEQQSGNYLILNLCHHFDSKRSFTSMTLVRDTYGRRGSKK